MTAALTGCRAPEMRGRTSERVKGKYVGTRKIILEGKECKNIFNGRHSYEHTHTYTFISTNFYVHLYRVHI